MRLCRLLVGAPSAAAAALAVAAFCFQVTSAFVVAPHDPLLRTPPTTTTTTTTTRLQSSLQQWGAVQEGELFPLAQELFPNAITYNEFLTYIVDTLVQSNFDISKTVLGTSLCGDELNRPLEQLLKKIFGANNQIGGMAGCPLGGVTSFRKMKSAVDPNGGNCVIVQGTHAGISSQGQVGSGERPNKQGEGDLCCASAILASQYVSGVYNGAIAREASPANPMDASQFLVQEMLLPHAQRLEESQNKMIELPYVLYEEQLGFLKQIIADGSQQGEQPGQVAVFGGIALNTPPGYVDYFVPLNGNLYGPDGANTWSYF